MLTCLHRQVQTLSGELDRYRAGGSSAQQSFEELKAEKEAEYAEQRRSLEELSKRCKILEMENSKLSAHLQTANAELNEKSTETLEKTRRIEELEAELLAERDTVCSLRIAMKSTNLEARHSDHRAVRTAQQSHDDAEAKMRKAMRQCQELEARVYSTRAIKYSKY